MNIDDLRKTTKDNPVTFMSKKWMHYDCDMGFLRNVRNERNFNALKGKDKLMLAYVGRNELGTMRKFFYPLSDFDFKDICDYEVSCAEIGKLPYCHGTSLVQLSGVPILMQEVRDECVTLN